MGPSIHHIALRTFDRTRLERFYVEVVGLSVVRRDDLRGSAWLAAGAALVMIEQAEAAEPCVPVGSRELLAFATEDVTMSRDRLARTGIEVEAETAYTLYFRDPDGRRVGLSTFPIPSF